MPELCWFEAVPPRDTSLPKVTAVVRTLAGRSHYGLRRLQPLVVFEMWLHPDHVRWLVGCEEHAARTLPGEFMAQLPGLVLMPVDEPDRPHPVTARELRFSSLTYPLRLDTASAVTAGLLRAGDDLHDGEAVVVQFVVGPSHVFDRVPTRQTPLDLLGFTAPREPDSGERQAFKQKVAEPLVGVRGRIGAVAAEPRWAGGLLRPVLAALSLANGAHGRLSASQQSTRTAAQLVRVMGRARTWSGIVNAAELSALIGWCNDGLEAATLPSGFPPPPAALLATSDDTKPATAVRLLGTSTHPGSRGNNVWLPFASYAASAHVTGPPGVGKSTLLATWGLNEAQAGRSLWIMEPKGDLVADVISRLPAERHDDLVVVDPGADGPVVGINPLAGTRKDAERRADSMLHLFRELFGTAIGPRSADTLLHGLIAICRLDDGTLPDVVAFLTNPGFRRRVLTKVADPLILSPWAAWFDGLSDGEQQQVVAPVMNKLRALVSRPQVRRFLSVAHPRFRLADLFESPKIVLVNLNAGAIGEAAALIGALLLNQLWEEIQRQTTKPPTQRREVSVIVDEFPNFVAGLDFVDVLARARGAKTSFTLANQHLRQVSGELQEAILANVRTRASFRPAEGDAATLARVLGKPVTKEDLERLPAFHAVARVLVDGAPSAPFEVATAALPEPSVDAEALRRTSAERYGVDPNELDAAVLERWQGSGATPDGPIGARRKRS